jgi:outer membrane protein OmpA-like peptidoglycan-associated protein
VASALKGRPTMKVRIEGHTDSRGNRQTNLRLSQARADAVKAYLVGRRRRR